jgi:cytochrome c-type biogenesis protein CcmF
MAVIPPPKQPGSPAAGRARGGGGVAGGGWGRGAGRGPPPRARGRRPPPPRGGPPAVVSRNRGFWGGQLAHLGVALVAVAIAVSGGLDERMTTSLTPGESVSFAGYEVTYEGPFEVEEAHRTVTGTTLAVARDGRDLGTLEPSVNAYHGQPQAVGTPAVRTGLTEDLYAALRDLDDDRIAVELIRYPFMWLLWVGGLTIAAGAVWALTDRRTPRRRRDEPVAAATPPDARAEEEAVGD